MPEGGRVIAGAARGVRLEAASGGTRPLSDRVKQALFATLEAEGALSGGFLDLFAGTGAAGIEALSRGAEQATFVERDQKACALIKTNLRRADLADRGEVVRGDVLRYLGEGRPGARQPFRAAVIDPPYDAELLAPTLDLLGEAGLGWLAGDSVVVAKHFWRDEPAERVGILERSRQKRFGETTLSYYTRAE
jgi:16S rRNA (guanine966-N2)-methyltransferase